MLPLVVRERRLEQAILICRVISREEDNRIFREIAFFIFLHECAELIIEVVELIQEAVGSVAELLIRGVERGVRAEGVDRREEGFPILRQFFCRVKEQFIGILI